MKILKLNDLFDPQNIVENKILLDPFVATHRILHMYAPGGVGKTFFSLMMAHALATGQDFLDWKNTTRQPVKVLYLDGEMGKLDLRDRLALIEGGSKIKAESEALQFMTYEDFKGQVFPNLAAPNIQRAFSERILDKVQPAVLIIDNLDTCTDKVEQRDGEAEIFKYVRIWLNQEKSKGRAVIVVDHANKGGEDVYGTSKKQNACDVMIQLKKPAFEKSDCSAQNYYELHFRKGRQQLDSQKRSLWIEQYSTYDTTYLNCVELDYVRMKMIKTISKPKPLTVAQMLAVSPGKAVQLIARAATFVEVETKTEDGEYEYDETDDDKFF